MARRSILFSLAAVFYLTGAKASFPSDFTEDVRDFHIRFEKALEIGDEATTAGFFSSKAVFLGWSSSGSVPDRLARDSRGLLKVEISTPVMAEFNNRVFSVGYESEDAPPMRTSRTAFFLDVVEATDLSDEGPKITFLIILPVVEPIGEVVKWAMLL